MYVARIVFVRVALSVICWVDKKRSSRAEKEHKKTTSTKAAKFRKQISLRMRRDETVAGTGAGAGAGCRC